MVVIRRRGQVVAEDVATVGEAETKALAEERTGESLRDGAIHEFPKGLPVTSVLGKHGPAHEQGRLTNPSLATGDTLIGAGGRKQLRQRQQLAGPVGVTPQGIGFAAGNPNHGADLDVVLTKLTGVIHSTQALDEPKRQGRGASRKQESNSVGQKGEFDSRSELRVETHIRVRSSPPRVGVDHGRLPVVQANVGHQSRSPFAA